MSTQTMEDLATAARDGWFYLESQRLSNVPRSARRTVLIEDDDVTQLRSVTVTELDIEDEVW